MSFFRKDIPTIVGLIFVLTWQLVLPTIDPVLAALHASPFFGNLREWAAGLLVLALILWWERLPLSSIGWRAISRRDLLWAVAAFLIGSLLIFATNKMMVALHLPNMGQTITTQFTGASIAAGMFVAFTAGITEEIMYRGFMIERLAAWTGSLGWGAAIAVMAFAASHVLFWGIVPSIQIAIWSLVITAFYVWRRNLGACMIMHILTDSFGLVIAPLFLARSLH
jgi:membrane protease YdiL (CAAX protease family)